MIPEGWVRFADIARSDALDAEQKIGLLAMALEELAIAEGLVLVHGVDRGLERYISAGGHVRFHGDEMIVPVAAGRWAAPWRTP